MVKGVRRALIGLWESPFVGMREAAPARGRDAVTDLLFFKIR